MQICSHDRSKSQHWPWRAPSLLLVLETFGASSVRAAGARRDGRTERGVATTANPIWIRMVIWARRREASCERIVAADDHIVWRVMVVVI